MEIELAEECACPLSHPDSTVEDVHNQITQDTCHAEVTIHGEAGDSHVVHSTTSVDESCLCLAFSEVGCVPRIQRADSSGIIIETFLSERSIINDLIERLDAVAERVSLRRLTTKQSTAATASPTATIDLSHLTEKQREAAMIAVSEGYYETPRRTDLETLAATLEISKSALSQRLNAVESKLTRAVFDSADSSQT
ncbi:transcriptional regulator [Haloferax mediterranei ATCC 33500]|uniref:Transcriptional regulator n=1 Tax=Haloferax mediterranei (strain ATCC 33500 / DSM 1411 / JCM 8866 / NBRC 14739 / NCIMB 2177 / R-4) TaxID=523841 RepID=M0IUE7_HALMT|nr:helix-turn-helix domain-containing protein [Haloferax mediterranei]ELZ99438.1 transcriptional regulator [Haloferax mediterranei ATCC 33500]QCQ76545.1 transcriptional regulator [Haloferax mediterranei ATCC 33500]